MQAMFSAPLPWQQAPWQQLWQSAQHQRLAHAFLLSGPPGLGKTLFAEQFAQALLCTQKLSKSLLRARIVIVVVYFVHTHILIT